MKQIKHFVSTRFQTRLVVQICLTVMVTSVDPDFKPEIQARRKSLMKESIKPVPIQPEIKRTVLNFTGQGRAGLRKKIQYKIIQ